MPEGTTAWYFGDDYAASRELMSRLPETLTWGDTGRRLNEIAERHTEDFVNLADRFDVSDWDWWETRNLAERGPLSSTFTAECCRMILFGQCLDAGGVHLFICEAGDLARILQAEARRRGRGVSWFGPGRLAQDAKALADQAVAALRFGRAALRRIGRVRRLQTLRRRRPVPVDRLRRCNTLFAAWTQSGDFPHRGLRPTAHYMGRLPDDLRTRGMTVGYLALPLDWIEDGDVIQADVVDADDAAILPDDAVTAGDVARTALRSVRVHARPQGDLNIGGQPLAAVARMVLIRERFDWRAVNARLLTAVGPYLVRNGCRPDVLFHVYENQTWEKGLRIGIRRALPQTRIAGVHQSPFSKLYLNMLASRSEVSTNRWPDAVFTHGAHSRRQLTATGAPADKVIDAGLFRPSSFILSRVDGAAATSRLVIATGVDFHECCELVVKGAQAAMRSQRKWDVLVNFHPATAAAFRDALRRFLETRGMAAAVSFTEKSISDLLRDGAAAVLYADTNAAFEAVSSGARAINIERDHALSFDKLPDGLARRLYAADDIAAALDEITDDSAWPSATAVEAALDDCFSPSDAEKIASTLGLAVNGAGRSGQNTEEMEQR